MYHHDFISHVMVSGPYFSEGHWKEAWYPRESTTCLDLCTFAHTEIFLCVRH